MPPRQKAEPPGEETSTGEPGEPKDTEETHIRQIVREELHNFLEELGHPGPEEAGIPEDKLEAPEEPKTLRQIEEMAERVVRKAQEMLSPPEKEKPAEARAEPEREPEAHIPWREKLWR
jgi:hypothetical protein